MDSASSWIWTILVAGVVIGLPWVWLARRSRGIEGSIVATLRKRILTWLRAADIDELSFLRQQLEAQRSELLTRLDRLEVTLTDQGRLENWATEVNTRLCQLELSEVPRQEMLGSQPVVSKSILCLGARVTLADQIWSELGIVNPQDLQDSQINKWIQGPFCRNCLRSLVVHDSQDEERSVRTQCRYCSLPWREDSLALLPLRQVKREVYEYLDIACRNGREGKQ
ncbi:MAG: hypothetical protein ACPGYT_15060 [Nitrospirales bacterium]